MGGQVPCLVGLGTKVISSYDLLSTGEVEFCEQEQETVRVLKVRWKVTTGRKVSPERLTPLLLG